MRLLMAHERWATTSSKLNPGLGRMLRDVGGYLRGGCALVTGEVDGGHAIPVLVSGRDTSITIRRGEQQVLCNERALLAFALAAVDAVTGEVLLGVDGPGYVDLERWGRGFGIFDSGGDDALRGRRRGGVCGLQDEGVGVAGFELGAGRRGDAADDVDVDFTEVELFVGVVRVVGAVETSERRKEAFVESVGAGDFGIVGFRIEFAAVDAVFGNGDWVAGSGLRDGLPAQVDCGFGEVGFYFGDGSGNGIDMDLDGVRIGRGPLARGAGPDGEDCVEAGGGTIFCWSDRCDDLRAILRLVLRGEFAGDGFDDVKGF